MECSKSEELKDALAREEMLTREVSALSNIHQPKNNSMWERSVTNVDVACALRPQKAVRMSEKRVGHRGRLWWSQSCLAGWLPCGITFQFGH